MAGQILIFPQLAAFLILGGSAEDHLDEELLILGDGVGLSFFDEDVTPLEDLVGDEPEGGCDDAQGECALILGYSLDVSLGGIIDGFCVLDGIAYRDVVGWFELYLHHSQR